MKKLFFLSTFLFFSTFTNAQWVQIPPSQIPVLSIFNSVRFINQNIGFVVGTNGKIIKTTDGGNNWVNQSYSNNSFTSVFLTDTNIVYVVGQNGIIIKSTDGGSNWDEQNSYTTSDLFSIFFTDKNTGYIAGYNGTILKTTNSGSTWSLLTSNTTKYLNSIFFTDSVTGFIAGLNIILKTTDAGTSWVQQPSIANLQSIFFVDNNIGFATGYEVNDIYDDYSVIYKTTNAGALWEKIYFDFSSDFLMSVYFSNNLTGYFVGDGPILKTNDGGISWDKQWANGNSSLREVYFVNDTLGFAIGWGCVFKTTNGGENFIEIYNLESNNHFSLYPNPATNSIS